MKRVARVPHERPLTGGAAKLAALLAVSVGLLPPAHASPLSMKGIALGLYHKEADEKGYSFPKMIDEIRDVGASHVSLVVSWRQRDVRATKIGPDPRVTLSDARLRKLIRHAHKKGLDVLLFPILEIEVRRPLEWRGTLAPENVAAWWASYEAFVLHYAKIAAQEKVAVLSIGSELSSTETWRDRWFHLISQVKKVYDGKLIYSANWDHYEKVSFWERVDYMGVTAYNELTRSHDATIAELAMAWAPVRQKLAAYSEKIDRPLVITEIGYTSQDGAAIRPWDYTGRAGVDLEEQRRAYAAFVKAWQGEERLFGVYWWNWFGAGGPYDTYYTPRKKPAEAVLRRWYNGSSN